MANNGGNTLPRIEKAEHIGPTDTGDNIEAKRVANYNWDSVNSQWTRAASSSLIPFAYDAGTYMATSPTVDTYKYYVGGTSGTLVATLTVTYTDSSHNTLVSWVRT